jgi:hypothetical protein
MARRLFDGMLARRTRLLGTTLSAALVSGPAYAQSSMTDNVWRVFAQISGDSLPLIVVLFLVAFTVLLVGFFVILIDA